MSDIKLIKNVQTTIHTGSEKQIMEERMYIYSDSETQENHREYMSLLGWNVTEKTELNMGSATTPILALCGEFWRKGI